MTATVTCSRALEYRASLGSRYPTPDEAVELYRLRDLDVHALQGKAVITADDITQLDRLGKFAIAVQCFDQCDARAQLALTTDVHHGVRAAAVLSALTSPKKQAAHVPA